MSRRFFATVLGAVLALPACAGGAPAASIAPPEPASAASSQRSPIQHVIIVIQENRSFENLFAGWPGADAPMYGYAGKKRIPLRPIRFILRDLDHGWHNAIAGWDGGKMDGFANNDVNGTTPAGTFAYSYLEHSEIGPYRAMAAQYVLADRMFPTMFGASFTAHLDLIAGTTNLDATRAIVGIPSSSPWGCDAPTGTVTSLLTPQRHVLVDLGPFPCFARFRTMADTLDAAGVSWKYYAPLVTDEPSWSAFDAIRNVRFGADWAKVISPQTQVLEDAANGTLAQVSWVTPDGLDSDHPGEGSDTGPSWVASVVNAIGTSPAWNSSAIVILWDDWGGWYDDAPPPQIGYQGLGIRVPCIVISPYAKRGFVSHTQYEFGSILKFVEETYALPQLGPEALGYTDGRARSIADMLDFSQAPRTFVPIASKYPRAYFQNRPPSMRLPDTE